MSQLLESLEKLRKGQALRQSTLRAGTIEAIARRAHEEANRALTQALPTWKAAWPEPTFDSNWYGNLMLKFRGIELPDHAKYSLRPTPQLTIAGNERQVTLIFSKTYKVNHEKITAIADAHIPYTEDEIDIMIRCGKIIIETTPASSHRVSLC